MIYKITVKTSKISNGIRVERGMSVDVVTNFITNSVTPNKGQSVALNMVYMDFQRIR